MSSIIGTSQTYFSKTYDNQNHVDVGGYVKIGADGTYYLRGGTNNGTSKSILIYKLDDQGNEIWKKEYANDTTNYYSGNAATLDMDSKDNLYITGSKDYIGNQINDAILWKLNPQGDTIWTREYITQYWEGFNSIKLVDDNHIMLGGETDKFSSGNNSQMYLVKVDSLGEVIWEKEFGGAGSENIYSIDYTYDKGYILGGYTTSKGAGSYDTWIVKTDSLGVMEWDTTFGGVDNEQGYVLTTLDSGYLVFGHIKAYLNKYDNAFAAKLDMNGKLKWYKEYGNRLAHYDNFNSAIILNDGYILCGNTDDTSSTYPIGWILKTNLQGDSLWSRTFQIRNNHHYFQDIESTGDGGAIMSGFIFPDGGKTQDLFVVKVDSMGCEVEGCNVISSTNRFLDSKENDNNINIYPNPNNGIFTLNFSSNDLVQLRIFNFTSKLVYQIQSFNSQQNTVDVSFLNKGIYLLMLESENGTFQQKFIVE